MDKNFIWSILILTMPQRAAMLARLLAVLEPQIPSNVELLIRKSDPALPVGENREALRQEARGEYISFIDDDDLVPPHFVERILPLLHGVDYVAFNLEQRVDGRFGCIERRSLRYGGVGHDETGRQRWRDISHLNPMRRELALRVAMTGWPAEDSRWADGIRSLNIVRTEHCLDETLYYYLSRSSKPELQGCRFMVSVGSEPYPWSLMPKIKVKILTSIAGLPNADYDLPEHSYVPGEMVELHSGLAQAWIEGGIAEVWKEPKASGSTPAKVAPASSTSTSSFPSSNEGAKQEAAAADAPPAQVPAQQPTASASSGEPEAGEKPTASTPRGRRSSANQE